MSEERVIVEVNTNIAFGEVVSRSEGDRVIYSGVTREFTRDGRLVSERTVDLCAAWFE